MKRDRFDLEQEIMRCWDITSDLQVLLDEGKVSEETIRVLITLYEIKFDRLFKTLEECVKKRKI